MALWKEVDGYEGLYLVSDEGEVVSLRHETPMMLKGGLRGKMDCFINL